MAQVGGLRITLALAAVLAGAGCGPSRHDAERLAAAGRIDGSAPIRSSRSMVVAAPPAVVWRLLADVTHWPSWQPAITDVRADGPARAGSRFAWTDGGVRITSRLALAHAPDRLAWTGRAAGLTAIHVWTLAPLSGGRTLVRTEESMAGLPSSLFYSSAELGAANAAWLQRLKTAAEHR